MNPPNKSISHISLDGVKRISMDVLLKLINNSNVKSISLNSLLKISKGRFKVEKIDKKIFVNLFAMKQVDEVAGHFFSKLNKHSYLCFYFLNLESFENAKHLFSDLSCYLDMEAVYAVSDEVAFELSKFKGKGEMLNLCLFTDFAIDCLSKTALSFQISIDFLFEKTSACFINKKRNYISINKVKYINEAVAANLARANVKRLSLNNLENLSAASAEILSKCKIEEIYISDYCKTNKSALEKFYSNRNPDGTKKENYEI